ncbi:hypothetical protein D3C81_2047370 [compost metagenome]
MLKKSERVPSQCWAISRWPVLEMGRNSVRPSRMPNNRAESRSDMEKSEKKGRHSIVHPMLRTIMVLIREHAPCWRIIWVPAQLRIQ